jgi:NAD(P)-dependent dehydrogenase (short-subunit alcohol dehydrogenase family)
MMLEDRVAVITGAGRGIGKEMALFFAQEGAHVVLSGRSVEAMQDVADQIKAKGHEAFVFPMDLRDADSIAQSANQAEELFGRVDVLVNNSAIGGPGAPLWEIDPADWEDTFRVNVTGTFLTCRAFLPGMIRRRSGSIILVGSTSGKRPHLHRSPYASTKMALIGLTRTLAAEVGPFGIRVNLISPGAVEGERLDWALKVQAEAMGVSLDEVANEVRRLAPLNRLTSARDVAAAAAFLASDRASAAVTGIDLNVNAGLAMY